MTALVMVVAVFDDEYQSYDLLRIMMMVVMLYDFYDHQQHHFLLNYYNQVQYDIYHQHRYHRNYWDNIGDNNRDNMVV